MTKKIRIADLPEFDFSEHLDSEQAMAEYLTVVLEDNDPSLLAAALGDIARARGMSEIARASGITREALYKALRPDAQPRFDTISRVCTALGVKLVAQAVHVGNLRVISVANRRGTKVCANRCLVGFFIRRFPPNKTAAS